MIEYLPSAPGEDHCRIAQRVCSHPCLKNSSFCPKTCAFYSQTAYLQWAGRQGDANPRCCTVGSWRPSATSPHPGWRRGPEPTVAAPGLPGFPSACCRGWIQLLFRYSPESWGIYNCFGWRKYTKKISVFLGEGKWSFPPSYLAQSCASSNLYRAMKVQGWIGGYVVPQSGAALAVNDFQRFSLN